MRTEMSGLCPMDVHIAHGDGPVTPSLPLILGHEGVGRVVQLGPGVIAPQVGTRVALGWLGYACGMCRCCATGREDLCVAQKNRGSALAGTHAEYAIAAAAFAVPVPASVSSMDAASLTCAGVTALGAVRAADVLPAERVAVFGVGGPGYLALQYARLHGAEVLAVDLSEDGLALATAVGADHVIGAAAGDPTRAIAEFGGVDVAIVFGDAPGFFDQAIHSLRWGGRLVIGSHSASAATLPVQDLVRDGIRVIGTFGGRRQDLRDVFRLQELGRTTVVAQPRALSSAVTSMQELVAGTVPASLVFDLSLA